MQVSSIVLDEVKPAQANAQAKAQQAGDHVHEEVLQNELDDVVGPLGGGIFQRNERAHQGRRKENVNPHREEEILFDPSSKPRWAVKNLTSKNLS